MKQDSGGMHMNKEAMQESVLLDMARSWDALPKGGNMGNQSEKDQRALPQCDGRETLARKATELAGLCRGLPMHSHDESNGYKREYIMYMLATQILHQARIEFKESFNIKPMQGKAKRSA